MRLLCSTILVVGLALPAHAAADDSQGWSFSGSLTGSANSEGVVTKVDPVLGYHFNRHFSTYTGVPFYFVNLSSNATSTASGFMKGVGNAFLGFNAGVQTDALTYTSNIEFTAPTGDKSKGFSTGRVTADWTNRFSAKVSSLTPFANVGIANTVSDTTFFVRPFTSLGLVGHFEGGATYGLLPAVRLGASAYAVRGSGQQRIISKVTGQTTATTLGSSGATILGSSSGPGNANRVFDNQTETVSQTADIVNDHGFSTWFGISPRSAFELHAGYSRSVSYDFNTLFFGVGFHVGK